ncbi:MAG: hypothetical protein ACE5NL_00625 [Candidatus Hydrothermarchaeaceae archaeon]
MDEKKVTEILEKGPATGNELHMLSGIDIFELWRICSNSEGVLIKRVGKRYLRFDKNVEGFARLSPSIQREFSTYSVIGLKKDRGKIEEKVKKLHEEIKEISRRKFNLARNAIDQVMLKLVDLKPCIQKNTCFIIGGDVPIGMAHGEPRPERSTGEMVAGSDLDIVVITSDDFPDDCLKKLDDAMYEVKYALLKHPSRKEEIDYLIKNISKVKEQAKFETFEHMVACKIIEESKFLYGNERIYRQVLDTLEDGGVPGKLEKLEGIAAEYRKRAEEHLLKKDRVSEEEYMKLFTTTEEFSEIF